MKVVRNKVWALIILLFIAFGCNKDDGISVTLQNEVNEFVWFAMNTFYYWQDEVEDLSIEKYPTYNELYGFLNGYERPELLFEAILVDQDRFSWIVDDYEILEGELQGVSMSFGYELGLLRLSSNSDQLLGYVKYVVPGGPADLAGLKRGDFFLKVDDTDISLDNYTSLLLESSANTLTLAELQDDTFSSTEEKISLTAIELSENPILIADVLEIEGQKVGYLMYNQFVNDNDYHRELNDVFGDFLNRGVTDLVLDLRYNGGGSLTTARILSSMIYGFATSLDVLTTSVYKESLSDFNTSYTFFEDVPFISGSTIISVYPMNRLKVKRIFILTSGSSASASELVITGLLPYMDVTVIGTKTVGKNVGSRTFYDSPRYTEKGTDLNPNHKYAIQPIISQFSNSVGFTDYIDGLEPNIEVNEINYLGNFTALGDPSEPLLAEALAIITGTARTERLPDNGLRSITPNNGKDYLNTTIMDDEYSPSIQR